MSLIFVIFISVHDWFLNILISILVFYFSLSHHTTQILNWQSATESFPHNQIALIKWITSILSRILPDALIKVCWCGPPQDIDYISADVKRVRDSTLHSMWAEEWNSSIRQRGEWLWGFPLKTRRDHTGALPESSINHFSLKGLVALSFSKIMHSHECFLVYLLKYLREQNLPNNSPLFYMTLIFILLF